MSKIDICCSCFKALGYYENNVINQFNFHYENNVINPVRTLIIVDITSFFDSCFDSFFNSSSVNPSMYFFISLYELALENIDLGSEELILLRYSLVPDRRGGSQ